MGDNSNIEWTDATWNPIVGCSIVSPGCRECYAMKFAARMLDGNPKSPHYAGTTMKSKAGPVWTGKVALAAEHILMAPRQWTKPRMIFVNSMGDLFHEDVPDAWIDKVFCIMALSRQHTFQVLTKRADRMRDYFSQFRPSPPEDGYITRNGIASHALERWQPSFSPQRWPLPNVWLGVSVEDQKRADERIPDLLHTPAAVRFISAEPLLGDIDLADHLALDTPLMGGIPLHWVIAGGESGPNARPMHPDWARSLRDQCAVAGVPFFFKQWGEWAPAPIEAEERVYVMLRDGRREWKRLIGETALKLRGAESVWRVGKHLAGRLLDGREHNGMPEVPR
jgi:protein gp37